MSASPQTRLKAQVAVKHSSSQSRSEQMSGVWVLARAGEHRYARLEGEARQLQSQKAQRMPPSHLWPATIRTQLHQCPHELVQKRVPDGPDPEDQTEASSELSLQAWQTSFQDLHCLAVGYMEVEVEGTADYTKLLDGTSRLSADFWAMTNFCHNPLVFCKVSKALLFHKGVSVHALGATLTWQARNWSFLLTPTSVRTLQRHWASSVHPAAADTRTSSVRCSNLLACPACLVAS